MALVNEGLENDLLRATEQGIEAGLNPQTRVEYQRIVLAGIKIATKGGANGIMRNLRNQPDPVKACAIGAVNLVFLMFKTAQHQNGNMPEKAMVPACYTLMLQALDVAAKMELVEITPDIIATATKEATNRIMANMRITPDKLNMAASKVHAVTQNAQQMQAIKLKIGADRDPRAPTPTLPEAEPANAEG